MSERHGITKETQAAKRRRETIKSSERALDILSEAISEAEYNGDQAEAAIMLGDYERITAELETIERGRA